MRRTKRVFAVGALLFLIGFTVFGVMFVGEMKHASELMVSLPEKLRQISTAPTRILSADGKELFTVQAEFREPVTFDKIPKHVRDAVIAAEDKRFFDHQGVDYWAMGRILLVGAKEGHLSQGGSTLTMQMAKKFYSEGERTFNRKLQDVALAITIEREMTKDQILTLYLNMMYFGERAYGVQAASEVYFGKSIDKLSVAEAAMLARCLRRPGDENPVKNLQKATDNRNVVLGIMRDEHMINGSEYEEAVAEKPHIVATKNRITSHTRQAPFFVDHVFAFLDKEFPDVDFRVGGYTIYTTLDSKMQAYAEKEVRDFVREERRNLGMNTAAFVLVDKDGKIIAEVGGVDYGKSQFNIVTQGLLQPGSSFKPIMYASALSTGALSMNDYLENQPFDYPVGPGAKPWHPRNASPRENGGPVSVEKALALSLNIPAAHVMERVTPTVVAGIARDAFGFTTPILAVPSMALGSIEVRPIDMAQAYSVFMLHGDRFTPYPVTKITSPDGSVLREFAPQIKRGVFEPRICDDVERLLRAVVEYGTGTAAGDVPNAHGKTGTTQDNKDAWFCGYSDGLVGIGWVGHNEIRNGRVYAVAMSRGAYGGTTAARFWAKIVGKAHDRFAQKIPDWVAPQDEPQNNPADQAPPDPTTNPLDRAKVLPPTDGTTGGDGAPPLTNPDGSPVIDPGNPTPSTTPPQDNPPKQPPRRPTPDETGGTVQVEVCAESGMRATIYCPETVTRTFKKGREPRGRCTIHGG